MRKNTKTILIVGGVLLGIALFNRLRTKGRMISDESSGLFGLGIGGIL